ncbi:MAG: NUDIX domain-containing protein [Pyrinomonadaceae bacterium]|nr:NUDIX domain-containing protein [Pyrinomonadaceae bacterium]
MLHDLLGAIWRGVPKSLRRWTIRVSQSHFAVSAGAIITDNEGRVLLLKHRFRPSPGWGIPGGFIEKGEQPEDALRRELREEVELEVKDVKLLATRAFNEPKQIEILFTARAIDDTERLSFEIQKAAWFSLDELPPDLPKDQVELIKRAFTDGVTTND